MQALSHTTLALIDEANRLARERSLLPWNGGNANRVIASSLERIADAGEWIVIPRIISLSLDSRREVAEAAAQAVKRLRACVSIQNLGVFDRTFRELSPYSHPEYARWRHMQPRDLKAISGLAGGATLLQFAMCHPSGYVREEAIRRSATCADGSEIPLLLLRTNDWVRPVQEAAHAALRTRLQPDHLPDLVAAIPMLEQMRRWGRIADDSLLHDVDALLAGPLGSPLLVASLASADRFVRRGAYRRLVESENSDHHHVFAAALQDNDPAIRSWAGRRLSDAGADVFLQNSTRLLSNSIGSIRFGAARRLVALDQPLPWETLLFDAHAGVRAIAQMAALQDGANPADEYRKSIPVRQGGRLGAAIIGLSETGSEQDIEMIRGYLLDRVPRVRRSALHALAKLKVDDIVELCLVAMRDARPSVAHAARDLLLGGVGYVSPARVWTTFVETQTSWGQRDALTVLSHLDYWSRLPYLLRAVTVADPDVKERASLYLSQWLARQGRVFTSPSTEIDNEARELIEAPDFSETFRLEIRAFLDSRARWPGP